VGGIAGFVLRLDAAPQDMDGVVARMAYLQTLCASHNTAFIVRDHLGLALEMGADGVHLGGGAGDLRAARAALGRERILGVSCGASRDAAMVAGEQGADYVAFGDLRQRPGAEVYELLRWWSDLFVLPCLAEVATMVDDCARLGQAGADLVAAGEGMWMDPEGAAAAVRRLREALRAG
jgi:thiamine-phosphate pyrophosphorylase